MIDKTQDIKQFIAQNFTPGTIDNNTFEKSNDTLLFMLFDVFPQGCIDTFELHEILISLGYTPQKKVVPETNKATKKTTRKIYFVWCFIEK